VGLVPLTEGGSVNLDDRALHERVRPDELVVRRIVDLIIPTLGDEPLHRAQRVRTVVMMRVFFVTFSEPQA
jgi:hypothetical protein